MDLVESSTEPRRHSTRTRNTPERYTNGLDDLSDSVDLGVGSERLRKKVRAVGHGDGIVDNNMEEEGKPESSDRVLAPTLVSYDFVNLMNPIHRNDVLRLFRRNISTPNCINQMTQNGVTKTELLAIRFGTPENAAQFKVCALVGRKILWIH